MTHILSTIVAFFLLTVGFQPDADPLLAHAWAPTIPQQAAHIHLAYSNPPPRSPFDVQKSAPACVVPGDAFEYQLTYQNYLTTHTFENIIITETLPAHLTYTGGAAWTCEGQICTTPLDEVPPMVSGTLTLPVALSSAYPYTSQPTLRNVVETAYSFFALETPVYAPINLTLESRDQVTLPTMIEPGELITYTLTYYNEGPITTPEVRLSSELPDHTTYVRGGWQAEASGRYTLDVGALSPGQQGTADFVVRLDATAPTTTSWVVHRAQISSALDECRREDNQATEVTHIAGGEPLHLYVANRDAGTVAIYDARSFEYLTALHVGPNPFGMAVDEEEEMLYVVANTGAHTTESKLVMIDLTSHTILREVIVGHGALHVATLGDNIYVTNSNSGAGVTVIDKGGQIKARLVNIGFFGITPDHDRARIYAAKFYMGGTGLWSITPTISETFEAQLEVDTEMPPYSVTYNPATDQLYAAFGTASQIRVYDPATFAELARYDTETQDPQFPGHGGHGLATMGACVYASNYLSQSVTLVAEGSCLPALNTTASAAPAFEHRAYLPLILRRSYRQPVALAAPILPQHIATPGHPKGIAAGQGLIFVTLPEEDQIAVIDAATHAVIHTIPSAGRYPHTAVLGKPGG